MTRKQLRDGDFGYFTFKADTQTVTGNNHTFQLTIIEEVLEDNGLRITDNTSGDASLVSDKAGYSLNLHVKIRKLQPDGGYKIRESPSPVSNEVVDKFKDMVPADQPSALAKPKAKSKAKCKGKNAQAKLEEANRAELEQTASALQQRKNMKRVANRPA